MVIREKKNFKSMIIRMLTALGYDNVQPYDGEGIDITAVKNQEKYCFKCRYDIDAIGEKKISDFIEKARNAGFDHMIYVTNSSFISGAKKKGERENVELWDRNTLDRMTIGIADEPLEDEAPVKVRRTGLFILLAAVVFVLAAAAVYYFLFFQK